MDCPVCGGDITEYAEKHCDFEYLNDETLKCPLCGVRLRLEYEETWDGESEGNYFWLEVWTD